MSRPVVISIEHFSQGDDRFLCVITFPKSAAEMFTHLLTQGIYGGNFYIEEPLTAARISGFVAVNGTRKLT